MVFTILGTAFDEESLEHRVRELERNCLLLKRGPHRELERNCLLLKRGPQQH